MVSLFCCNYTQFLFRQESSKVLFVFLQSKNRKMLTNANGNYGDFNAWPPSRIDFAKIMTLAQR